MSMHHRQNPEYQEALGQTLHNVIKNIPGGVLVFFPCYKMIEEVVTTWKVCSFLCKLPYLLTANYDRTMRHSKR